MTGITDELAAFLRDEAANLDRLADSIDVAGAKQTNGTARAYSDGAAFVLRNTAQTFRDRIPTELHDHDFTPADFDDVILDGDPIYGAAYDGQQPEEVAA